MQCNSSCGGGVVQLSSVTNRPNGFVTEEQYITTTTYVEHYSAQIEFLGLQSKMIRSKSKIVVNGFVPWWAVGPSIGIGQCPVFVGLLIN